MYAQRNQSSGTLLTQSFHPHSAEDQFSQGFLEEQQQQQQQQYNQEQLEEIQEQLNSSNLIQRLQMTESNNFAFQAFENNTMLGGSLPSEWTQNYEGDEINGFVFGDGDVFVDGLISQNFVDDPSWMLAQNTEQQTLHNIAQQQESQQIPSGVESQQNSVSQNNDHVHLRAQTPGPLQKTIFPNYLNIRRRSLSADNIHALAKAQQQANRKVVFATQQQQSSMASVMNFEQQIQFSSIQNTKQQTLNPNGLQIDDANDGQNNENDGDVNNHNTQNTTENTNQNARPHLSRTSSASPINHAQRLNELQARFKVKLDRRTQRSMPNIQLTAAAQSAMSLSQAKTNTSTSGTGTAQILDLSSVSTPNTPTFPPEKSNVMKQPNNQPRRGHMRKRSLSAPTAPFPSQNPAQMPGSIPLQPTQSYPINFPLPNFRRPNALPIQIQRNPKHNHNSPPMSSEEYQRKLDEELEKVDFEDITVSELKEMLRQRGKPATGKKAVLMQRLQEEVDYVKAMKNHNQQKNNGNNNNNDNNNNNNNNQFSQIISSPTSPSGVSLQRSIANLHISSPPSRRFSPYGSVSIPGSPRMMPSGLGNGRPSSGFNGGNIFPENAEEWQYHNVGLVQGNMTQPLLSHNLDDASIMMMEQQSQDIYGTQQPSSAPPTTTEFDAVATTEFQGFQQQPSSAPPMTTEFVETFDFMNPMSMNVAMSINPDMMRLSVSDVEGTDPTILLKQEPGNENKNLNAENRQQSGSPNEMLVQQSLGFDLNAQHHLQDEDMMIKSEDNLDFLNYTTTSMASISHQSAQHLPMQIELSQEGMSFGW